MVMLEIYEIAILITSNLGSVLFLYRFLMGNDLLLITILVWWIQRIPVKN